MKSVTTTRFRKALDKLPRRIQTKARYSYSLWKENPEHPSLHFKQIHSTSPIYSVRIGIGYRALGVKHEETLIWFWIGSHEDYNNVIKEI